MGGSIWIARLRDLYRLELRARRSARFQGGRNALEPVRNSDYDDSAEHPIPAIGQHS